MKNIVYIFSLLLIVVFNSCKEPERIAGFEDAEEFSMYYYMLADEDKKFSDFMSILEVGGIDKTLSAYNPDGTDYTLFLPDNDAIKKFIDASDEFSSVKDMLDNKEYCEVFSRYHVVNMGIHTQDFPFGAFPEPTLSDDYLTVSFVIETDTSYYKINNQAAVTLPNIEVSNGFIHQIEIALEPITFTSFEWLEQKSDFSIFKEAIDLTGLQALVDFNVKEDVERQPVTMLVEPDVIYQENGVNSVDDLADLISPDDNDYTNLKNPLNNFIRYHILTGGLFIDDFEEKATNYATFSEIPLNINGVGLDILINKGKQVFDTIIYEGDTTFVDYIGFLYDESNVISQSGALHFIDRIMTQQTPSRAIKTYEFWEEPLFNEYRLNPGTYLIEDENSLQYIKWSGADLFFVDLGDQESSAWSNDYIQIDGDFIISYEIPKIIQGKYDVFLGAHAYDTNNALVEVFIDGKKVSGLVDLSKGGSANYPFQRIEIGAIDFKRYSTHLVEIKTLIPGRLLWDYIRFEPI
ncbi:MAG: fasciclin domain-containing protein [Draconibacterium sp.]|nr:fasciclin domain-containing protein [Draconibacterium sp.]